jgi:hypothetical protein
MAIPHMEDNDYASAILFDNGLSVDEFYSWIHEFIELRAALPGLIFIVFKSYADIMPRSIQFQRSWPLPARLRIVPPALADCPLDETPPGVSQFLRCNLH